MEEKIIILCPQCRSIMLVVMLSILTNRVVGIRYLNYTYGKRMVCPFDGELFALNNSGKIYTDRGWV